jgi:hypothetical protein
MKTTHQSHLQTVARSLPVSIGAIISSLPGCKGRYSGIYRETIDNVFSGLDVMRPKKFVSIGSLYSNQETQRNLFIEYMLTEYWGGQFIENYLQKNPSTPHKQLLLRHASDEKRHSTIFAEIAGTRFSEHLHSEAYRKEERYHQAYERWIGDDFFSLICLLHGFELRSAVIQSYWFTVMYMFPGEESAALHPIFAEISTDEVFHVTYTMQLVCDALDLGADPNILTKAVMLAEATLEQVELMAEVDIAARTNSVKPLKGESNLV